MRLKKSYKEILTYKDLQIIDGLAKYSPRNIMKISREIGIPESTIRYRIKVLKNKGVLQLYTNIYHTNIGLKKHVVFATFSPEFNGKIYEFFDAYSPLNIFKVYGNRPTVYSVHIIPPYLSKDFRNYLDELKNLGIVDNYKLLYSTCYHNINPTSDWFDILSKSWYFGWDTLVEDIDSASSKLPITLMDPDDFPILADKLDIMILRLLETDPTISYSEMAKRFGTTPQNIKYHFENHIEKNFLIEDYDIQLFRFPRETSIYVYSLMEFTSWKNMAKTANTLRKRAFSEILGKILGKNMLLGIFYLPIEELWSLITKFNELVKIGILKNYEIYISSANEYGEAFTIPYRYFKDGRWVYPSPDYYIERLHRIFNEYKVSS